MVSHVLPSRVVLIEQHQEIRKRLQLGALEEPYKSKWEAELKGGGNGTNIMAHVFTEERFWKGTEGWLLFFNYMITKMSNEAVVESMGGVLDRHASGERHLQQPDYAKEAFIHWNAPKVHDARQLLSAALDRHFKGKAWHFTKSDRGARTASLDRVGRNKEFKVSKVVDRLASEKSRLPFMADPPTRLPRPPPRLPPAIPAAGAAPTAPAAAPAAPAAALTAPAAPAAAAPAAAPTAPDVAPAAPAAPAVAPAAPAAPAVAPAAPATPAAPVALLDGDSGDDELNMAGVQHQQQGVRQAPPQQRAQQAITTAPDAEVATAEVDNMTANGHFARWGEAHTPPLGEHAGTHLPLRRLGPDQASP